MEKQQINAPKLTTIPPKPHLLEAKIDPAIIELIRPFLHSFFTGSTISSDCLDQFVECLKKNPELVSIVFGSTARKAFPGNGKMQQEICKQLIHKLETLHMEPSDTLYECLCQTMAFGSDEHFYRIFPLDFCNLCSDNYIVIQEEMQQISQGTTGLSCWQASFVLADFLLSQTDSLNQFKCILELGAGCGLAGIAAAKYLSKNSSSTKIVLSDSANQVLCRLCENVKLNFGGENNVEVKLLDWANYRTNELPPAADLILAADVVYDPILFPSLARLLHHLLLSKCCDGVSQTNPIAYFACTCRDPATLAAFLQCIDQHGINVQAKWEHRVLWHDANSKHQHSFVRVQASSKNATEDDKGEFSRCFEPIFSPQIPNYSFVQNFKTIIYEFTVSN